MNKKHKVHPQALADFFEIDRTTVLHAVKTAKTMIETNHKSYVNALLLWDDIVSMMMPVYIEDYKKDYSAQVKDSIYRTFRNAISSRILNKESTAEMMESVYSDLFDGSEQLVDNNLQ